MKLDLFPEDIIKEYGLRDKVDTKGNVHCEVRRGMYGLPQAGIMAQDLLEKRLATAGYRQSKTTPGYWTHDWWPISFALVVDDFGMKYIGEEHAQHLINALKTDCKIEEDWDGNRYLGMTLDWAYKTRQVHLSMMPGYVEKALTRFGHQVPNQPHHQPHKQTIPTYGAMIQYAKDKDTSRKLSKEDKKYIQQVLGTFLYYGRAVDSTMLTELSSILCKPKKSSQSN
jgi:hypothetical protein